MSYRINLHGIIGTLAILFMLVMAYTHPSQLIWMLVAITGFVYSGVILLFTRANYENNPSILLFLWGVHLGILMIDILLLVLPLANENLNIGGKNEFLWFFIFPAAILTGLAVPRLSFQWPDGQLVIFPAGAPGVFVLVLSWVIILFTQSWVFFFMGLLFYVYIVVFHASLGKFFFDFPSTDYLSQMKLQSLLGLHLSLLMLSTSTVITSNNPPSIGSIGVSLAAFILCVAIGFAIPYMLIREA